MGDQRSRDKADKVGNAEVSGQPEPSLVELPRTVRMEISELARTLAREHRPLFASNPTLRKRAGQFLTALLPPKPKRRGTPGNPVVTKAIRLRRQLRRQCPDEPWAKI
jgi:hypothetical protein